MNLSAPFIYRPVMTTLVMLALLLLGIMAYEKLPVSNLPDVNYPTMSIDITFPGASPLTMANTVATPLEKEFLTIPGVTNVTSTSNLGKTNIIIEFEVDRDIDGAAVDVQAAITRARPNLPPDLPAEPSYRKVNPSDTPILYIAITSATMLPQDLYTIADTMIGQRISTIDGVAQVQVYGSPFAVRIQVDPNKLATVGLTLADVQQAVVTGNPNLPSGQLDGNTQAWIIQTDGQLPHAADYNPVIVAYRNNAPVRVRDLGKAIDSLQTDRISFRYVDKERNQPTVVIAVRRQPGANTVKVANEIKGRLPQILEQIPSSVELEIVFDRSDSIVESIFDVKMTLVIAFILVILVIYLYLGKLRDTIIPSLALPLSIIGTFAVMYWLNFTINNLTLLALTLAIGFIVDDAIVVLENIVRRVEEGDTPWHASLEGSRQISFTILSMTLSLVAVFIPMLFMGGLIGKIFREFAITLAVVTLLSGIVSLTLTPMLCSLFIPPRSEKKQGWMERFSDKLNHKMLAWYEPKLKWILRHRPVALAVGALSVILSGVLFKVLPTDFIPDDDIGFIIAFNQGDQGVSTDQMKRYQQQFINILQQDPNIDAIVSLASYTTYREGLNFIKLKPHSERESSFKVIQELYPKTAGIVGFNSYLKNVPLIDLSIGAANKGPYQYVLYSLDSDALYAAAEELYNVVNQDPTFQGVTTDMEIKTPQLYVDVLRDQASRLGVSANDIETAFLLGYSGNRVSRIQTPINLYDVIVELDRDDQRYVNSIPKNYVKNTTVGQSSFITQGAVQVELVNNASTVVPLNAVAKWREGVGPASINHISQFPAVTITYSAAPGIPLGTALEKLKEHARDILPANVIGVVKGAAETFEESISNAGFLLLLAIICIYIVLGILYESFVHPLTILSTLPPAALGGLATIWFFGIPLSLYAYLGIILLIGIVKKNGIMIVDYALDYLRNKGETPERAIYHASIVRFRPIMMTTMAAVFGALPLALAIGAGADSRRPLGLVIIGGLLFAQLVTLFLTPVIYLYLEELRERLGFKPQDDTHHERAE